MNRELAVVSHLLSKALEWGWIERRRAKIRKIKEENGRIVYLSPAQADGLLEAAKADQNWQIYPFILIGLRTSMRKSEILAIRREDVDLHKRFIYIPSAKAGPTVPANIKGVGGVPCRLTLETLPNATPWLFPSVGAKQGHTTVIRKAFMRAVTAAGLDPKQVNPHTLRHTAITHLVQAGVGSAYGKEN